MGLFSKIARLKKEMINLSYQLTIILRTHFFLFVLIRFLDLPDTMLLFVFFFFV